MKVDGMMGMEYGGWDDGRWDVWGRNDWEQDGGEGKWRTKRIVYYPLINRCPSNFYFASTRRANFAFPIFKHLQKYK